MPNMLKTWKVQYQTFNKRNYIKTIIQWQRKRVEREREREKERGQHMVNDGNGIH